MPYIAVVEPLAERAEKVRQANSSGRKDPLQFRGATIELDVKRVPSASLVYRMANIRTIVRQQEVIKTRALSDDYFSSGEENREAQELQHQILVGMAKDPTADIYSSLREHAKQIYPLLITVTGVVLNGNRRLAAMRDLHSIDPQRYALFTHIEVSVLPEDANEDDLSEIETRLQIAPDLRSAYGWVEEALGLFEQLNHRGWDLARASSVWGVPQSQLRERLAQLTLAEQYLDFIGASKEYAKVADSKQAIETFLKAQRSRSTAPPSRLDAERLVMFAVLSDSEIADRKYNYAKDIEEVTTEVIALLDVAPTPDFAPAPDPADPLSGLLPSAGEIPAAVLDSLGDPGRCADVAELAEAALADIKARRNSTRRGRQLLDAVKQALAKISGLTLTNSETSTYPAAMGSLIALQAEATRLMTDMLTDQPDLPQSIDPELSIALGNHLSTLQGLLDAGA